VITRTSDSRGGSGLPLGDAEGEAEGDGELFGVALAMSSGFAELLKAIILPSGDHCGFPAPRVTVVN
jgi:hypothetical protein